MQIKWLRDCQSPEEITKRKEIFNQSQSVLDILSQMCYNSIIESDKTQNDYNNPNWAYKQADLVGYKRAMNEIIKLCKEDH